MIKLTVLYGHPENPEAFEEYYASKHLPLAAKIPNVERFEVGRVSSVNEGEQPPHYRIAELWFESAERMGEALSSPEGVAATGDLQNFAPPVAKFFVSVVSEVEA